MSANWSNLTAFSGMDINEIQQLNQGGKPIVIFYSKPLKNNYQSKVQNRPVFEDTDFLKIILPGQTSHVHDQPVTDVYRERYPTEWALWQQKRTNVMHGTPIDVWYAITESQKAEFRAMNIFTIEQFAGMADIDGMKIMGFNELRQKAKLFLEAGKDAELLSKVKQEAASQVAAMQAQLDEMKAQMAALSAAPRKSGGWPKGKPRAKKQAEAAVA